MAGDPFLSGSHRWAYCYELWADHGADVIAITGSWLAIFRPHGRFGTTALAGERALAGGNSVPAKRLTGASCKTTQHPPTPLRQCYHAAIWNPIETILVTTSLSAFVGMQGIDGVSMESIHRQQVSWAILTLNQTRHNLRDERKSFTLRQPPCHGERREQALKQLAVVSDSIM